MNRRTFTLSGIWLAITATIGAWRELDIKTIIAADNPEVVNADLWYCRDTAWNAVKENPGVLVLQRSASEWGEKYRVLLNYKGKLACFVSVCQANCLPSVDVEYLRLQLFDILRRKANRFIASGGSTNSWTAWKGCRDA